MCGITGIISNSTTSYIYPFTDAIAHRGPDSSGIFEFENIALGHRRLSIQDLTENGHQPMISEDERYVLIFNGEIYNHWELRKKLKKTYSFKSTSDTETILYFLIENGTELLNDINGIFAFAFLDKKTKKLTLARDQFGVKPLYYYHKNSEFLFSSELKSFIHFPNLDKTIEPSAIANYLNFLYAPGTQTPFQKILKLLPGHYISLDLNNLDHFTVQKYYQIPFDGTYKYTNEAETIQLLDQKLNIAVERQLLSDVEIGFFLSGGLDSSLLAVLAKAKLQQKEIQCYTIFSEANDGFEQDITYARKIAKTNHFKLNEVKIDINIVDEFDKMIYHLDEPQADPAPINVLKISQKAHSQGLKVLIGGTAGDDLFSGYRRHQALNYEQILSNTPQFIGKLAKKYAGYLGSTNATARRISKLLKDIDKSQNDRLAGYYSWIENNTLNQLFSKEINAQFTPNNFLIQKLNDIPNEKNWLNKMLYWEMSGFLPDHNLNYTDKMSMATGLEVRVPFLDKELVEFSTQIHPNLKMKGNETKYILKKVAEKYLDKNVIYRPKTGFGAPIRQWITKDLDDFIQENLSEQKIKERGLFNYKAVQQLIQLNKQGKIDASYSIWSLLAIESWMKQFT